MKIKVLFICVHNSARSQMAEELLKKYGGDKFEVESAGFEPTVINPLVAKVLEEEGIDLTKKKTQSVFSLIKAQKFYGYVVTVCSRAKENECPIFPGMPMRLHWDLENPEDFTGSEEERIDKIKEQKEQIKQLVLDFINEYGD